MIVLSPKNQCTGCTACLSACPRNCIVMIADAEGCEYPSINMDQCIECGLCESSCPVINQNIETKKNQKAFIAQHIDSRILLESTSGGAFTALASVILSKGGVVYGAAYNSEKNNFDKLVVHKCVRDKKELAIFRNSKYVQSSLGTVFSEVEQFLAGGQLVMFSGTPCQIEGLKLFLKRDYQKLVLVDFVCRAVPVPIALKKYIEWVENKSGGEVSLIKFRDKSKYGYRYSMISSFEKEQRSPLYRAGVESDPYLRAFFSNMINRPCCYNCSFKKRYRASDITLWDCFISDEFSDSLTNNGGVTRILIHSDNGLKLLNEAKVDLNVIEIDADKAVAKSNEMFNSVELSPIRDEFMSKLISDKGYQAFDSYFPDSFAVKVERCGRIICERLGIYDNIRKIVRKMKGK